MYDPEIITSIINDAKQLVSKNRKKYDDLMKIVEHFISNNDIIVKSMQDYFFDLYTNDMYSLPMKLTDLLYNSDPIVAKYVMLEIKIYKYHSRISIDGIQFVHFTYINQEIKQNILDYTCLSPRAQLPCKSFGPEVMLINIYQDIINPLLIESWDDIFKIEIQLFKEISDHFKERLGGNDTNDVSDFNITSNKSSNKINNIHLVQQMMTMYSRFYNELHVAAKSSERNMSYEDINLDKYKKTLLSSYINEEYHVLIGQIAINAYNSFNKLGRLQVITSRQFNDEITNLKQILGDSITYNIVNLMIPTNLNLHRMTVYLDKSVILDIYNAGTFELVNYHNICDIYPSSIIKSCVNIGTPFVIMRFRLIDIWYTLYSIKKKHLNKDTTMPTIYRLLAEYINIRRKLNDNNIISDKYIGIYEDILLNKQRITAKLKDKYIPPYFPYLKK